MTRFPRPGKQQTTTCQCKSSTILLTVLALAALGMLHITSMVSSSMELNKETIELGKKAAAASDATNDAETPIKAKENKPSTPLPSVTVHAYYSNDKCQGTTNMTTVTAFPNKPATIKFTSGSSPTSMRITGEGELKFYDAHNKYMASAVELEGCITPIDGNPKRGELTYGPLPRRVDPVLQKKFFTGSSLSDPHTRIVFSAESSIYFGYQTVTNAFAFLQSNQTNASWLRLLSAERPDDLAQTLPTFTAPRTLYSKKYSPMNKPDIIEKWLNSQHDDAPNPDDTIAVIDPDNWLIRDVSEWTTRVSRHHAIGQIAYYYGNNMVENLWHEVCKAGCNNSVAHVGVPYVLKASDLKEVVPLWRQYLILLNELRLNERERFVDNGEYASLHMSWASEMYAYNFACAHLGIDTDVDRDLQIRDVDARVSEEKSQKKAMIHMGRAWFPQQHAALAEKWRHTEGKDFARFGIQVWCKCNHTGHEIMPWPLPDGLDFQSYHTLRLLHEAREWYGPIPENTTFRPKNHGSIA